jgi:two-component system, OmpR family, KDP operon response regulator KdpE
MRERADGQETTTSDNQLNKDFEALAQPGAGNSADKKAPICLVIEDDSTMRHLVTSYLEDHDIRAVAAARRDEVAGLLARCRPDLVVLDLRLGQDDGLDLLREIRTKSDVPVIITTGHRRDEIDRVVGLELGADDYITKPFGIDELLARIRTALRHRLQLQGERPLFRSGDLAVDLVRRTVRVRDAEVKLSPKEYDILRALVAHAGQVLTHKFLLKEVWGGETDPQYLRIYVRGLRQKIEADPSRPRHILTESGVGYRLCAPD